MNQTRYLKFTTAVFVSVDAEAKKWKAESNVLGLYALADTPEGAVKMLEQVIAKRESEFDERKVKVVWNEQKNEPEEAEESEKAEDKEAEQIAEDTDTKPSSLSGEAIEQANIGELREIALDLGIDSEGLTKKPLRENILKAINGE